VIVAGTVAIDVKVGGADASCAPGTARRSHAAADTLSGLDHFGLTVKDIDAVAARSRQGR